jgi:hypothetical protein
MMFGIKHQVIHPMNQNIHLRDAMIFFGTFYNQESKQDIENSKFKNIS